jgi:hypothetical protein
MIAIAIITAISVTTILGVIDMLKQIKKNK